MKFKKIFTGLFINIIILLFISANISAYAQETYNYTCDYMYSILETKAERDFYDALYANCKKVDQSSANFEHTPYTSFGNLSFDSAQEVAFIFSQDHPEFFWLGSQTMYSSLYGAAFIVIEDFQNGIKRQDAKEKIEAAEQKYIDAALEFSTDFEKVQYFCNELLKNVTYETGDWDQTIASVFLQNKTVCAGYSKAFELLCNAVGIDTIILTSCVHAWNAVKIDGHWFLIDVTNNSSNRYFLISDSKMAEIDRSIGTTYTVKQTVNGVENVYEFYMHDIDYLTYLNYYDDFPECAFNYSDIYIGDEPIIVIGILGDSNLNGIVNIRDAAYIANKLVKGLKNELPDCSDFNEDGVINIRDAAAIAKYLVSSHR